MIDLDGLIDFEYFCLNRRESGDGENEIEAMGASGGVFCAPISA